MRIRAATLEDLPALQAMGLAFIDATPYARLFHATPDTLDVLARLLFSFGDSATILLAEDETGPFGMLAIVAAPHPISQQTYADEVVWWVDPIHRGGLRAGPALLRSAEEWARARGCYMIKMVAPVASTVGTFYERLGYSPIETAFAKVL